MATKKHNIIVLAVSGLIAIALLVVPWKNRDLKHFEKKVYPVTGGWGYDILVNKHVFIHQESIPVIQTIHTFATKEEAEKVANLVIQKLEAGHSPSLNKSDLEQILPVYTTKNDQHR